MSNKDFKPKQGSTKNRKRAGRGNASGLGGECGRGHKGQKARTGYSRIFGFEGGQMPLYFRTPKLSGFKSFNKETFIPINFSRLESYLKDGDLIDNKYLVDKGLIKTEKCKVKVLGNGELNKKVSFCCAAYSKSAIEKITSSGSKYKIS